MHTIPHNQLVSTVEGAIAPAIHVHELALDPRLPRPTGKIPRQIPEVNHPAIAAASAFVCLTRVAAAEDVSVLTRCPKATRPSLEGEAHPRGATAAGTGGARTMRGRI